MPGSATSASLARAQGQQESHIAAAKAKRDRKNAKRARDAEANDEGSMRPADDVIISHLDDEWRTAPAVHRLLGEHGAVADIAYALELRMALRNSAIASSILPWPRRMRPRLWCAQL